MNNSPKFFDCDILNDNNDEFNLYVEYDKKYRNRIVFKNTFYR